MRSYTDATLKEKKKSSCPQISPKQHSSLKHVEQCPQKKNFFLFFNFGCIGSLLLRVGFLWLGQERATLC